MLLPFKSFVVVASERFFQENQLFLKKNVESFGGKKKCSYLCIAIKKNGSVAQLNRASDYGSEGYRFESCRSHKKEPFTVPSLFCILSILF